MSKRLHVHPYKRSLLSMQSNNVDVVTYDLDIKASIKINVSAIIILFIALGGSKSEIWHS